MLVSRRNIPRALLTTVFWEEKAHACENAWLQQMTVTVDGLECLRDLRFSSDCSCPPNIWCGNYRIAFLDENSVAQAGTSGQVADDSR